MTAESFLDGKVTLHPGDCLDVLKTLEAESIDSIVTDPPYHLTNNTRSRSPNPGQYTPIGKPKEPKGGFMGKQWDGGDIAFRPDVWVEVLRVLKPGAHLVAFGGTRTYHRMACAIEDAGFEIRDSLQWLYGSGFPKSHNIGNGWGTALKPACEPIVLARKPLIGTVAANVLAHGTGALNIDGCRIGTDVIETGINTAIQGGNYARANGRGLTQEKTQHVGRWPANVIHDGSDEVVGAFPDRDGASSNGRSGEKGVGNWGMGPVEQLPGYADSGSASRFFYTAKADADDRLGSKHPTVKPLDLMQWLVRLVTPKGGLVLDPFAGTGTTGEAAWREGMRAILIEREAEYCDDIRRRMAHALSGPEQRKRVIAKARHGDKPIEGGLFA